MVEVDVPKTRGRRRARSSVASRVLGPPSQLTTHECNLCGGERERGEARGEARREGRSLYDNNNLSVVSIYRAEKKSLQILLSYTLAGPGRKAKQGQE